MGLFGKKKCSWEETEHGRRFTEKMAAAAEKRAKEKEAYERNVPPEKKEQVKLFKIIFTAVFAVYAAALYTGFVKGCALQVLAAEFAVAAVSFVLYRIKPAGIKYPNCFMMPVIAAACMVMFAGYLRLTGTGTVSENTGTVRSSAGSGDYEQWLQESGLVEDELIKDSDGSRGIYE